MSNTAIADALHDAGFNVTSSRLFNEATDCLREAQNFEAALRKFELRVWTDGELRSEICRSFLRGRADDMGGTYAVPPAGKDRVRVVKIESEGRTQIAVEAERSEPSLSTERDDRGRKGFAAEAKGSITSVVANPPRGIAAIAAVQPVVAQSIFKSMKLPDGRSLSEVQWHELPKLAREYRQHSRVLILLYQKAQVVDQFATVDQVVREQDVKDAIVEAGKANDVF